MKKRRIKETKLNELPNEVLLEIFKYNEVDQIDISRRISRKFLTLIEQKIFYVIILKLRTKYEKPRKDLENMTLEELRITSAYCYWNHNFKPKDHKEKMRDIKARTVREIKLMRYDMDDLIDKSYCIIKSMVSDRILTETALYTRIGINYNGLDRVMSIGHMDYECAPKIFYSNIMNWIVKNRRNIHERLWFITFNPIIQLLLVEIGKKFEKRGYCAVVGFNDRGNYLYLSPYKNLEYKIK